MQTGTGMVSKYLCRRSLLVDASDMRLPDLSGLRLDIDAKAPRSKAPQTPRPKPYSREEVQQVRTPERFNAILNNCAAYVLKVFSGFAECPYGPLWQYAPTRCRPLDGSGADDGGTEEQKADAIAIFLQGIPGDQVSSFADLLKLVQERDFFAFILSTAPNETKETATSINYHAMIGVLFEDASDARKSFGVTFGAYPTEGLTEGMCTLQSGSCKNNVEVVLGDQIGVCAREKVPRVMTVKVRVAKRYIQDQLVTELTRLASLSGQEFV